MPGQRLIDPADPASVARMLQRLDKVERDLSKVSGQHKRLKKKVDVLYDTSTSSGGACSNIQFSATDATHLAYTTGFVRLASGEIHQVQGATLTVAETTTGFIHYAVFNPIHGTMQAVTNSATLQSLLANNNNIYVVGFSVPAFGVSAPTTSATYPTGTLFVIA